MQKCPRNKRRQSPGPPLAAAAHLAIARIDLLVELVNDLRSKEAKRSATPTTSPHFAFTDRSEGYLRFARKAGAPPSSRR